MLELPIQINYSEAYLTLKCNLNCDYCINDDSGVVRDRKLLSAEQWIDGLSSINFKHPLTLGGGEPTIHPEFFKLVRDMPSNIDLDLLTNLQFNADRFIAEVPKSRFKGNGAFKSIRASFHQTHDPLEVIAKLSKLQDAGFGVGLFGINHPDNTERNIQMSELSRKAGVYFFIKDFLGDYGGYTTGIYRYPFAVDKGKINRVRCRINEFITDPEGDVYGCHKDLYKKHRPIQNILDKKPINLDFRECGECGNCNPCDIKLKTNRFLKMGYSSVEIERR